MPKRHESKLTEKSWVPLGAMIGACLSSLAAGASIGVLFYKVDQHDRMLASYTAMEINIAEIQKDVKALNEAMASRHASEPLSPQTGPYSVVERGR